MQKIAAALVKAQKAFEPARKQSNNPAFRSKYASLENCIDAVLEALNANGIFFCQPSSECNDGVIVETLFIHESGETFSAGKLHVPAAKQDPQGYGSALTYARRYSLLAACGIAPEDDDGNAASSAYEKSKPATVPQKPVEKQSPPAQELTELEMKDTLLLIDYAATVETIAKHLADVKGKVSPAQSKTLSDAATKRKAAILAAPVQEVFPGATVEP